MKRAFRYRFYPTSGQAEALARTFGCVRSVYNKALEERTRAYRREGKGVAALRHETGMPVEGGR